MRGPGPAQLDFVVGRAPIALQLLYIRGCAAARLDGAERVPSDDVL